MSNAPYSSTRNFLKNALEKDSKTVTLVEKHLNGQTRLYLKTGLMKPQNITMHYFYQHIRNQLNAHVLESHKCKVIFSYEGKDYLIIYNK